MARVRTTSTAALLCLTATLLLAAVTDAMPTERRSQPKDMTFPEFIAKYGKRYPNADEALYREAVFNDNKKRAAARQRANPHATFGVTGPFADQTPEEFKSTHHNGDFSIMVQKRKPQPIPEHLTSGTAIDWVAKGAVTGVKNQLNCGGCWSFSTTGNIEGQWFLAGHPLVSLSEEELLECAGDSSSGNDGCHGGLMDLAFQWLLDNRNGTIVTEASDPFISGDGSVPACSYEGTVPGAQISSYQDLPSDETKMATWVYNNGPISIAVDGTTLQTYTGGIITNCEFNQLDHAILIVGFDDTNNPPYWIVKNSWGTTWGESGYFRVEKGSNQCGLADAPTTSIVTNKGTLPPGPATPPPSPATPTPSSSASFTLLVCSDSACSDCTTNTLPQDACIEETFNGDSLAAQCVSGGTKVYLSLFDGTEYCNSTATTQTVLVNTCYENVDGETYLQFSCPSS